jgi:uncharacterized membrane protein
MESQVKWGIGLIVIGLCIAPFGFPFLLLYAIPLIVIGAALILFKRREAEIEEIKEDISQ